MVFYNCLYNRSSDLIAHASTLAFFGLSDMNALNEEPVSAREKALRRCQELTEWRDQLMRADTSVSVRDEIEHLVTRTSDTRLQPILQERRG
jgi:hypothetical protein